MTEFYTHFNLVPASNWPWPDFTPAEMACKGTRSLKLAPDFMCRLQDLRDRMNRPLIVNSGYRSPEYDRSIGGAGVHPTGRAVDIGIYGADAFLLVSLAREHGFTGIGANQKGDHKGRFIHLDDLSPGEKAAPRPWIWSYS